MKAAAVILIVLVLAAVCAVGYLYLKADLNIRFTECIATDAVSQAEYFSALKSKVDSSAFIGTRFTQEAIGSPEQYQFLTYTVRLDNNAFLKAEVIEIRITPMQGDVLQLGEETAHDLPAGLSADLSATILTSREMHSVREAPVTYYFWGIPFTTRFTLGK